MAPPPPPQQLESTDEQSPPQDSEQAKLNPILQWQTPEFKYVHKSPDWFWAIGVVALAIAIASVIYGNILFAIVIIIGSAALMLQGVRKPDIITVTLTKRGIIVEDEMYPYATLESFWIVFNEYEQRLLVKSDRTFMPLLVLPIRDIDPDQLRDELLMHLPEEEIQEPLTQKIVEYLGF